MTVLDFTKRSSEPELMDNESTSFEDFRDCLVDLATVNRLTLAHQSTLKFLTALLPHVRQMREPLHVVDIGSGYGDLLRQVDGWAHKHQVPVRLTGVDLNPWSRRAAKEATPSDRAIEWVESDIFEYRPEGGVDVALCSLFTHHLEDEGVVRFLQWMEAKSRLAWFISDLHRHPLPYHVFRNASRIARFHRFVQHDGPVSIARAFRISDWKDLLEDANIPKDAAKLRWRFPFKITLERVKAP